jgi:NADP-dependent 3-hydroxy acid dehydrogenase YdfG
MRLRPVAEQVMVITGASSGIGLATAQLAAEMGAHVVLAARSDETLDGICAEINANGGKAVAVCADVADRAQVDAIVETALTQFGRIDTWVNNAGVSVYGRLDEVSEADSRRLFDTNFWGVVNGSLAAMPHLRQSGGALINVGSEVSEAVIPLQGMYAASKHAVKGFTDALRVEVEDIDGAPVSVTLIQPSAVDTPFPQHAKNYMDREPKLPTPLIAPEEVARAIIDAARQPARSVKVGGMAAINTLAAKLAPGLADRRSAKQVDRQHYDEPPRNPDGGLWQAAAEGLVHGTGGYEASR